jgi:hypothetical protein
MEILDFNLAPNQKWFVKLSDAGATATVELYNTAADVSAGTNRVAYATGLAFGADVGVILTADATPPLYGGSIAKFNSTLDYHLRISAADGEAAKKYQVGPFTDLEAVEDALMLSEAVIRARAEYEINKGTHTKVTRTLRTAGHNPTLDIGDTVTFSSAKRGVASLRNRVAAITLEISIDDSHEVNFFDQLEIVEYEDFSRT